MRGKIAIAAMVALALGMAGFGWWWNYQRSSRSREFFGVATSSAIRFGTKFEALRIDDASGPSDQVAWHDQTLRGAWVDLSRTPGLLHARHSLLQDAGYRWPPLDATASSQPKWTAAVRFSSDQGSTICLFDFEQGLLTTIDNPRVIRMNEKMTSGWKKFLSTRLAADMAPNQIGD